MMDNKENNIEPKWATLEEVGVRYLSPEDTKIFRGTYGLLHI